jgi:hypothetical protein
MREDPLPINTGLTEDEIRRHATMLWEQRGRPEGYDLEFWLQAERELKLDGNSTGVSANSGSARSGSGSDGPSAPFRNTPGGRSAL